LSQVIVEQDKKFHLLQHDFISLCARFLRRHIKSSSNLSKLTDFIGAGAAGSSTAFYLQKFAETAGIPINVTVFERSSYVGGRSTTVNAYGNLLEPVELGASIFVEVNTILKNSSEAFGLRPRESGTDDAEVLGIWNGKDFVYTQKDSGWKYWDIAKLLWKYGLAPIRTQRLMKDVVGKFRKLYEYPFFPFRSLSDRVLDLDLTSVTSVTGEQFLTMNNVKLSPILCCQC
jgi:prenylcysteine oxidase/farnesylcysteine lyase